MQAQRDPNQPVGLILFGENPRENVEPPRAVIDRDRKVAVRRAGSGRDCLAQALHRRQRVDRAAAEGFGKRRLAAGVVRAALGHDRIATGDKSHADAIVAPLAQVKKGVVARRLCRPVGDDSPGGARGSVEMADEARQSLCADLDLVVVGDFAAAQLQPNLRCREAGPIGAVDSCDLIGAGGAARRRKHQGDGQNGGLARDMTGCGLGTHAGR